MAVETTDFGETDRLSAAEAADQDDAGSVRDKENRVVDATGNRSTAKHRILKTVCLYVSFGGMVRWLNRFRKF